MTKAKNFFEYKTRRRMFDKFKSNVSYSKAETLHKREKC